MVLKITPKQRTKINALVRKACCNCYKGNCLLLDDLEMFGRAKMPRCGSNCSVLSRSRAILAQKQDVSQGQESGLRHRAA